LRFSNIKDLAYKQSLGFLGTFRFCWLGKIGGATSSLRVLINLVFHI